MAYGCLQTTFCIFNAIIALLAAVCVGIGSWALADKKTFTESITKAMEALKLDGFSADNITNVAILIVIIGCIIMVIAGIGCCGAQKNSKCLLGVFFIAMIIICVVVIAVAVLVKFYPNKIRAEIEEKYSKFLADGTKEQLDEINKFQREFKCCGFAGPGDFPEGKVPESCTGITKGCADAFMETITSVGSPLFIAAIVTLIVLALATAISGYLYCRGGGEAV